MTQEQKDAVVRSLKVGRSLNAGQSREVLEKIANIKWQWKHELTNYLQYLKRKGLVTYFDTTKVWYWNDEVDIGELIKEG